MKIKTTDIETSNTYKRKFDKRDTLIEREVNGRGTVSGDGKIMPGSTYSLYDSNGNRVLVQEENLLDTKNITTRQMVYAADGTLLQKNDGKASSLSTMVNNKVQYATITAGGTAHHFSSNGNYLGEIAKDKAGRISSSLKDQHYTGPTQTDSSNVIQYQVQSGDSLKSLALNFYGNADYWYLIANLNGLTSSPDEALSAGLSIDIPARASSTNSANSFKPMDLQKIIGDTTPSLPYVPPAPAAGCNAVAMIVMIAITVVATIATAGAAAAAMGGVVSGATGMAAGTAVLSGTAIAAGGTVVGAIGATAAGMAAAAVGGFVGSAIGQVAGKALGVVDSFSLKNAFASGLTAGATAGLGNLMGVGSKVADGTFSGIASGSKVGTTATLNLAGKMTMAASAAGINVAANKLAGNNKASFQWRNVVTGAVTAGAMHGMGITDTQSSWSKGFSDIGFGADVLNGFSGAAVGYGVSKGLYNEGSWNFRNVATDVFGNALGNSIVAGLSAKSGTGQLTAKEQAALDQKMAAMDKKIQAKLNGQPGTTDPVIQMQSQNGVLVPQGSNPVEIFDWYKENGLLDGMDDQQYHKLAVAANAYEDKQFAHIKASMDHSQMLRQDLMRKQYSVDASAYRLVQLTHEMKYYALGGHNGVFDQYGASQKVTIIPSRPQSALPSPLAKFGNVQPGPWADGYVLRNSLDTTSLQSSKDDAIYKTVKDAGGVVNNVFLGISALDAIPSFSIYTTGKLGSAPLSTFVNSGGVTAYTWAVGEYAPDAKRVVGSYSGLSSVSPVLKSVANAVGPAGTALSVGLSANDLQHEYSVKGAISGGNGTYNGLQIAGTAVVAGAAFVASAPVAIGVGLVWGIGNLLIDSDLSKAGWQSIYDNW